MSEYIMHSEDGRYLVHQCLAYGPETNCPGGWVEIVGSDGRVCLHRVTPDSLRSLAAQLMDAADAIDPFSPANSPDAQDRYTIAPATDTTPTTVGG